MNTSYIEWVKTLGGLILSWPFVGFVALIIFHKPLLKIAKQFTSGDLESMSLGNIKLVRKLNAVEAEVDALRLLITSLLPRWESEILDRLNSPGPFLVETNNLADTFRRDLGDLWGRGFVRQIQPGRYLPSGQGKVDLKDFYAIDALGRQYVALRSLYLSSVKSDPNQNETPRNA